jgi:Leucine-rich repeat (LRR) protein
MSYELQSACWINNNQLTVSYRTKSMFGVTSDLKIELMARDAFIEKFGRRCLPPKPR